MIKETKKKKIKLLFIIPSEMNAYLDWASDFYRLSKSQIVRNAIKTTDRYKQNEHIFNSKESVKNYEENR